MCECANVFEILPGWALKLTYNIIFHNSPCNLSPHTSQHFSIVFIDDSSTLTLCHPLGIVIIFSNFLFPYLFSSPF